jgi:ribosomal protein S18 acetylase RimI-like enzyme
MDTSQYALEDFDKETEGEHILVALDDEIPVGFISLWLPDHFIHHLYISHTHTRKGIGRLLIEQTLTSIKKPVTLKCLIQNESAISFYIALGFREIGRGISGNDAFIHFKLG